MHGVYFEMSNRYEYIYNSGMPFFFLKRKLYNFLIFLLFFSSNSLWMETVASSINQPFDARSCFFFNFLFSFADLQSPGSFGYRNVPITSQLKLNMDVFHPSLSLRANIAS